MMWHARHDIESKARDFQKEKKKKKKEIGSTWPCGFTRLNDGYCIILFWFMPCTRYMHTNIISVIVLINIPQKLVVIRENPFTIGKNEKAGERRRSRVYVVDTVFVLFSFLMFMSTSLYCLFSYRLAACNRGRFQWECYSNIRILLGKKPFVFVSSWSTRRHYGAFSRVAPLHLARDKVTT